MIFDLNNQTTVLSTSKEGQTGILRNRLFKDKLLDYDENEVNTVYDLFAKACANFPNNNLFGTLLNNEYEWISYSQAFQLVESISSGLINLVGPDRLNIGLYSINTKEWCLFDLCLAKLGLVNVALFDTYGDDQLTYVINHAEISIIASQKAKIGNLLRIHNKINAVKVIVSLDAIDKNNDKILLDWATSLNVDIVCINQLKTQNVNAQNNNINAPKHTDLYTICYTSGTTGKPKGAMLTNLSFSVAARAVNKYLGDKHGYHFSYLPLAHCLERLAVLSNMLMGNGIGFYSGDIMNLMTDVQLLKPCLFVSVPRLFNRIYDGIASKTINVHGLKGKISKHAIETKAKTMKEGKGFNSLLWDTVIFNKVKQSLGGNIQGMLSGSAPLSEEVHDFLKVCFGCDLSQGYGLTETAAAGCITLPEMNYLTTDKPNPRGEILIRGPTIFKGYYKSIEQTKEVLDDEGWFYTGDIGMLNSYGAISIIDRKKNVFKLSQGEYIAPEKIEGVYQQSKYIMQIFVHGDSTQSSLVAIVVPDPEAFVPFAQSVANNGNNCDINQLCKDKTVKIKILEKINTMAKKFKLSGFELVNNICLDSNMFTIDNGLITPTYKLKRRELQVKYQNEIDIMYHELNNK